jgi:DNA phosphorothioation-associated putative methyltransferase
MFDLPTIASECRVSPVGKRLPNALYLHRSSLEALSLQLQGYEWEARNFISELDSFTLIKFHCDRLRISYLHYPDFLSDPHPALKSSLIVELPSGKLSHRDYSQSQNPPILHRKEIFLHISHPCYTEFATLTHQQETLGLLTQTARIGTRNGWQQRLHEHGLELHDHRLACPITPTPNSSPIAITTQKDSIIYLKPTVSHPPQNDHSPIDRHKAAIVRPNLSKPIRLALEAGLFTPGVTIYDYGCGHGGDLQRLSKLGYTVNGWDPYYRPESPQTPADIVNLGYILNVIENQTERRQALVNAWSLTQKILIVAAQVLIDDSNRGWVAYEDGVITSRNTFQKYYEQEELKTYIDQVLNSLNTNDTPVPLDAIPIAPGIYLIFRDPSQAQAFRVSRFRSRASTPRISTHIRHFEDYKELLQPLMAFYTDRGRIPLTQELAQFTDIQTQFGTLRNAFNLILKATDPTAWDQIADQRRNDLLIYLALSHFSIRPKLRDLDPTTQNDIKSHFGSYQQACTAADFMLLSLGNQDHIRNHIQQSSLGQITPKHLLIHHSLLDRLAPLLRLYEGCAARTYGRPDNANVIKLHANHPKITYLTIPHFDTDPHPAIQSSMQINLRDQRLHYRDSHDHPNPIVLHRKDQLIAPEHALYPKFYRLSQQEEKWGLLENLDTLTHQNDWQQHLCTHNVQYQGHRLCHRKTTLP